MARWSEPESSGSRRIHRRVAVLGGSLPERAHAILVARGYAVRFAADVDDLVAACSIGRCEMVILATTVEDAVDACRALRGTPAVHDTYVVALTPADARPADVDALLLVGANDLVTAGDGPSATAAFDVRMRIADAWIVQRQRRRRAESATRAQEAKFRAVFEGTRDAVLIIDDQGAVTDCNAAATALFGRDRESMLGVRLREAVAPNSLAHQSQPGGADPDAAWARFLTRGEQSGAFRLVRGDGSWSDVEYQSRASILPHVHLMVLRDVTEARRARDQLIIADRLASLGAVASGIGHEINNPLATISANLEYFQAVSSKTAPTEEERAEVGVALVDAREAVERLRAITTDLRAFSHLDELPRPLEVEKVVETAIRIAQHQLMRKARLVRDFAPVPRVQAAEGRLGHVVLHLLLLAANSIPSGAQRKNEIRIGVRSEDGRVVIEVTDTGEGLPADAMPRTLDALASTPPTSESAAPRVGLWLVRSIVESLGGSIDIANTPNRGTHYRVALRAA